jgi:hypothetical protein
MKKLSKIYLKHIQLLPIFLSVFWVLTHWGFWNEGVFSFGWNATIFWFGLIHTAVINQIGIIYFHFI